MSAIRRLHYKIRKSFATNNIIWRKSFLVRSISLRVEKMLIIAHRDIPPIIIVKSIFTTAKTHIVNYTI